MNGLNKRNVLIATAVALAVTVCYGVRIDGSLHPVGRSRSLLIENATQVTPTLTRTDRDPDAVYVILGGSNPDGLFDATRVDAHTGRQSPAHIPLGPQSGFSPFIEGEVRVEVAGLSLRRPTFHLLSLPDGRGPGVHLVDSDTGLVKLIIGTGAAKRTLITRWVFNSSKVAELRSLASTDAMGKFIAVVSRSPAGWMLHLFDRSIAAYSSTPSSQQPLEES
jgi:hypothetical protein